MSIVHLPTLAQRGKVGNPQYAGVMMVVSFKIEGVLYTFAISGTRGKVYNPTYVYVLRLP